MPKRIIIVRHGETNHNKAKIMQGHLDIPLNATGQEQAQAASKILKNEKIDVVFSSDLKRARETAQAVTGSRAHIPVHHTPLLRERYFGKFQGMTFDEVSAYLSNFGVQGNFSFRGREKEFGVESEEDMALRIEEFKKLLEKHKGKTVAVFSHGGFIKRMLKAFGVEKENIDTMYIPNAVPIVLIKKGDTYIIEE